MTDQTSSQAGNHSISVKQAVNDYRYAILHLSEGTQVEYLHKLAVFTRWCEAQGVTLSGLRQGHLRRYAEFLRSLTGRQRGREGKPLSGTTQHTYMNIVRIFLLWCSKEEDYEGAINRRLVERMELPKKDEKLPDIFTPAQVKALLAASQQGYTPTLRVRNGAILAVLLDTGVRASELCGLTLDCAFLEPDDAYLKVFGKGRKWREVPLGRKALVALRRYVTRYRRPTNRDEQHVFLNRSGDALTLRGLEEFIAKLGKDARVEGVRCSPHTFRHTFAVRFLEETGDVYRLMRLLGHTDIKITQVYLRAMSHKVARTVRGVSVFDGLF